MMDKSASNTMIHYIPGPRRIIGGTATSTTTKNATRSRAPRALPMKSGGKIINDAAERTDRRLGLEMNLQQLKRYGKPGDIILTGDDSLLSKLICFAQSIQTKDGKPSKWSHCMVLVNLDSEDIEEMPRGLVFSDFYARSRDELNDRLIEALNWVIDRKELNKKTCSIPTKS